VPHNDIDFEKWDQCIDLSVNGIFYASSWYLNMTAPGWDALVEDDYQTVMPLPHRKKLGFRYIFQPFFVQQLGVFSTKSLSVEVIERFFNNTPSKFKLVDYSLNTFNMLEETAKVRIRPRLTHHLDLIEPYEVIRKRYASNTRRNIRKAEGQGVFVTEHGRPEEIISAFRLNRGKNLSSFNETDYQLLKHLIYAGIHRGLAKIMTAYSVENTFCAGVVFFHSHNKTVLLFSGSTELSRENGAMFLIIDEFIRKMAGKEMVLDFEGSSNPDLARFYKGFGSKECVFLQVRMNNMPVGLRQLSEFYLHWQKRKRKSTD